MSFLMFLCHVHPICFIVETEQKMFMWGGERDFQKKGGYSKRWGWFKKGGWEPFPNCSRF